MASSARSHSSLRLAVPDAAAARKTSVDVLHRDLLLALAEVANESFEQGGEGAGELVRLGEVLATPLECLLAEHPAPVAFHRRVMSGNQLRGHHP
jgi:hypothetical protein